MVDADICAALSARCGGNVNIGVWGGEGACGAFAGNIGGVSGIAAVKTGDAALPVQLLIFESGADYAMFNVQTQGKARAVVYTDLSYKEGAEEAAQNCGCPSYMLDYNSEENLNGLLGTVLSEFPLKRVDVDIPEWTQVMPQENSAISELLSLVSGRTAEITKMSGISALENIFAGAEYWGENAVIEADLGTGYVKIIANARDGIFYNMLSEIAGDRIDGEYSLMRYVRTAAEANRGYEKVKDALECASVNGYGIVQPQEDDIVYDSPSVIRQGGNVGIKLKASAPSYHIIRVDVSGEVNPIMGSAAQSENMVKGMMDGFERNAAEMWNTDLFGKSLKSMVQEGLSARVSAIGEDARTKLRRALNRMVNEGKGGAIVIIL